PTLGDLLEVTALIAKKDPRRRPRVTARWLERYLEAANKVTIDEAAFAASALQALGGRHHESALVALRDMAEEATRRRRSVDIP
ncbi:MAG TPA: hypothetical protein VGU02_10430, partial [Gaiellaceae bacterium]|nr:hypothetical protein [Gaiellaceae bacterium]